LLLYLYGELAEEDSLALAVVGTRKPTQYGLEQTDRLTAGVARAGMCIVSGGAYGIDAAAHRAAMSVGARTIAVLGNGLLKPYPAEHTELFERIADGNGAVLSEFPMGMAPMRENFPRRNRIVSGLALGVLVVEADERSGALITARLAVEDHNREVMAVPGRVDAPRSAGCHKILREGWATLVTKPAEILEQLGEAGQMLRDAAEATPTRNARRTSRAGKSNKPDDQAGLFDATPASGEPKAPANLTQTQQSIWAHLAEPLPLERLTELTGMDVGQLQAELTMLEIQGQVRREGNRLRRGG
jgi:DNA processing protein